MAPIKAKGERMNYVLQEIHGMLINLSLKTKGDCKIIEIFVSETMLATHLSTELFLILMVFHALMVYYTKKN